MSSHALYRFFDGDGLLLYVGQTANPFSRLLQHYRSKQREMIRHVEIEWFSTADAAKRAEAIAIGAEGPLWNVVKPTIKPRNLRTSGGKHFAVAPPEIRSWAGADYTFSPDEMARAIKVCRGGDVLHVYGDGPLSEDVMAKLIEREVHVWIH